MYVQLPRVYRILLNTTRASDFGNAFVTAYVLAESTPRKQKSREFSLRESEEVACSKTYFDDS